MGIYNMVLAFKLQRNLHSSENSDDTATVATSPMQQESMIDQCIYVNMKRELYFKVQ